MSNGIHSVKKTTPAMSEGLNDNLWQVLAYPVKPGNARENSLHALSPKFLHKIHQRQAEKLVRQFPNAEFIIRPAG